MNNAIVINEFLKTPYLYLVFILAIMCVLRYVLKIKFASVSVIIAKNFENFLYVRHNNKKKYLKGPIFLYYIVPIFWAFLITYIKTIDQNILNMIAIVFTIFIGMLFNLLILLIDMQSKLVTDKKNKDNETASMKNLITKTYYGIMFEILISIIVLIISFSFFFIDASWILWSISFMQYALIFIFLFNLFVILKRIFIIIEKKILE